MANIKEKFRFHYLSVRMDPPNIFNVTGSSLQQSHVYIKCQFQLPVRSGACHAYIYFKSISLSIWPHSMTYLVVDGDRSVPAGWCHTVDQETTLQTVQLLRLQITSIIDYILLRSRWVNELKINFRSPYFDKIVKANQCYKKKLPFRIIILKIQRGKVPMFM